MPAEESTVAIRTEWKCSACGTLARMNHLALARNPGLELPRGWGLRLGRTYCEEHIPLPETIPCGIVER